MGNESTKNQKKEEVIEEKDKETKEIEKPKVVKLTEWIETKKAIISLGRAKKEEKSPASILVSDPWLFRMFYEIAILPIRSDKILVCGGNSGRSAFRTAEIFDIGKSEWRKIQDMPELIPFATAVVCCDYVFVFGGQSLFPIKYFSLETSEWREMDIPGKSMRNTEVAVVGDKVFIIDAQTREKNNAIEVVNVKSMHWEKSGIFSPVPTPRTNHGVAVIGHRIFCIGGVYKGRSMSVVEVLDVDSGIWSTLPPMPTARSQMGITVLNGNQIWVIGGYDSNYEYDLRVIEVYDVEKFEWKSFSVELTSPRNGLRALTLDGNIWVIGGNVSGQKPERNIEILDPQTGKWSKGPEMMIQRSWQGTVHF